MLTAACQRWRDRRGTYRVTGEPIDPRRYEVAPILTDTEARTFVVQHHYSASYPAACLRFGLYRAGYLVGIAVFSQPGSQAALNVALPLPDVHRLELGRFVLLQDVPSNGESWFLARSFELARREGLEAVVAHSDPETRRSSSGEIIFKGHIGCIYQSTNAAYSGRTPARTRRLFADGTVFDGRTWSKLRRRERGWRYAADRLISQGAPAPSGPWEAWVLRAVQAVTRPHRHGGSHRYTWALNPRLRGQLPRGLRYPKFDFQGTLELPFT